jgi:hypothetical protein
MCLASARPTRSSTGPAWTSPEQFKTVTSIDKAAWPRSCKLHADLFQQLAYHLPTELVETKAQRETWVWPAQWPALSVRFIGTTLWSDFDALGPTRTQALAGPGDTHLLAQQLKARTKACRAADYYLRKTGTTRQGALMLSDAVREQSLACQDWLSGQLAQPFDGTTVVVTHFAPSLLSADPRYGNTPGTAGFCNALDHLLPLAQVWLHGHLHAPCNYVHQGCHVVANPLGYARKNEQAAFDPTLCIEV